MDCIDRKAVLSIIMGLCETQGDYDAAYDKIMSIPTVPGIDRAAILRLCNEIDDIVTEISKLSENYLIYSDCKSIMDRIKVIGKELTGDDKR